MLEPIAQPNGGGMEGLWQQVPAKKPDTEKGRLEEECQESFNGQGRAKDVAHEAREFRPVHAELKLLDDAGHHTHGEVYHKELTPEFRHALIDLIARADVEGLHQSDENREAEREGDKEEVVHGGDGELPPRQCQGIHT